MSLCDLGRSEVAEGGKSRVDWADTAKALSIILLVLFTLQGTSTYFNQMLILARMPLFFFVSGLFARRVILRSDFETFAREKVGNLLYLYILWASLLFASTYLVGWAWWGREIDPWAQVTLLWQPFVPMWFFYGLAITFLIAWLCRSLPIALVLAVSLVAYAVAVWTGDWLLIPVFEKIVRLFPWFWLGLVLRGAVFDFVERTWRLWPLPLAGYLALSYVFMDSSWNHIAPLSFVITAIGLAGLLMVSAQLARLPLVAGPLAIVGASTLYIYATQHITIFYLQRAARTLGVDFHLLTLPSLVIVVVAGTVFGRWAARTPRFAWLFRAPWLGGRRAGGWQGTAAA